MAKVLFKLSVHNSHRKMEVYQWISSKTWRPFLKSEFPNKSIPPPSAIPDVKLLHIYFEVRFTKSWVNLLSLRNYKRWSKMVQLVQKPAWKSLPGIIMEESSNESFVRNDCEFWNYWSSPPTSDRLATFRSFLNFWDFSKNTPTF